MSNLIKILSEENKMVDTGWKSPMSVTQDDRRAVNGGNHVCYSFKDLDDIKKNDYHFAYISPSGKSGIDSLRASPVLYAYNYGFNIPANATIKKVYVLPVVQQGNGSSYGAVTKIKTIKIKTGSSTTDYGIGNNLANLSFIQKFRLPVGLWTGEITFKEGSNYVLCGGKDTWDVEFTPSVVNSTNFGFVFQVVGTELNKWVNPRVAKLLMKIEYEVPNQPDMSKVQNKTIAGFYDGSNLIEFDKNNNNMSKSTLTLNINQPNEGKTITIKMKHTGIEIESPIFVLESNGLSINDDKLKTYTIPTLHFSNDTVEKEYIQTFKVYPNNYSGEQFLIIRASWGGISANRLIKFNVAGEIFSSFSSEDVRKYVQRGQFCKVMYCDFRNNKAYLEKGGTVYGNGGAMCIYTEAFQYKYGNEDSNTYTNNIAGVNGNNLYWNHESY